MALSKAIPYGLPTTTVGVTAIDATAITVTVLAGHFPVLGGGEYTYAVLSSDADMSDPAADYETVKVTAIDDSDPFVLTVVRNQESTDGAKEWPEGTSIACLGVAIAHTEMVAALEGHIDLTNPHSATDAATASRLMLRDANARAKIADGSAAGDCVNKGQLDAKLDLAGGTMSGPVNCADQIISRPVIKDYGETAVIETDINGAKTIDLESGNVFRHTLSDAVTYTFSNPPANGIAGSFTLIIEQPAAAKTITWPASVKWPFDIIPTAPGNSKVAWYVFGTTNAGTRWHGVQAMTGLTI